MIHLKLTGFLLVACGLLAGLMFPGQAAPLTVTPQQMQSLLPDESNLQGFTRIRPAGELVVLPDPSQANQQVQLTSPASYIEDKTVINSDATQWLYGWTPLPNDPGAFSQIMRSLYSKDGMYQITINLNVCASSQTASDEVAQFLRGCSTSFQKGSFSDQATTIGDESWINPSGYSTLIFRAGKSVILIDGTRSQFASREGGVPPFPGAAVEAVAYQVLLRAAQQPDLTGVTAQQAQVAVNGHALPKGALLVGKQVYVPVQAFAKAMGLTSRWDSKTGALTLSGAGRKTVALTAGSTATKHGAVAGASLRVPVLKQAGQPVMTLEDLLTLTGGRIVGQSGNAVQVKA